MKTFLKRKLYLVFAMFLAFALNAQSQNVSVVSSGGSITSASYTTLKGAFDKIDSGFHTGVISITISGDVTETSPAVLIASGSTVGANYSHISIAPNGGPWTITGSGTNFSSKGLIILDGADNVKIDGGASRNLIFSNTATTVPAAIWLKSGGAVGLGCSNDTIINCQMKTGLLTAESYGIIISGYNTTTPVPSSALAAYDCDNALIQNNKIYNAYFGISVSGISSALSDNIAIRGNEIGSDITSSSIGKYGIYVSNMDSIVVENNKIYNVVNTANVYGVYLTNTKSFKVRNNNISNISTSTAASSAPFGPFGVYVYYSSNTSAIHSTIYNNIINGVKYSGAETKNVDAYGIYASKAQYLDIYNNAISGVVGSGYGAATLSAAGSTFGLFLDDATTQNVNIYYNTINLFGSYPKSTLLANNLSACIGINNSAISGVNIKDNSLTNALDTAASSTGALSSCAIFAVSGYAFDGTTKVINYNNYYVTGSGAKVALIGTTSYATYANWLATTTTDANSNTNIPNYNSNSLLMPLPNSLLVGKASPIASVSTDILGGARSTTLATIGAYEKAFDAIAPTIAYTKLTAVDTLTNRLFSKIAISDAVSGIDTINNLPRLYYKKSSSANDVNAWKYVTMTGATKSAAFTIDYSLLGGVSTGDTIQYFIVVKDLESYQANITQSSGTFAVAQSSVALTASAFPISGAIDNYPIVSQFTGTMTVGANGTYASLTGANGAFAAINSKVLTGDITLKIISDITETGAVGLNNFASISGNSKVYIVPNGDTLRTLSGAKDTVGLFRFLNARNVYINGAYNGYGRYLQFVNTSATSNKAATFHLSNYSTSVKGCRNISIKNSIVVGPQNTGAMRFAIYGGDSILTAATLPTAGSTTPSPSLAADHDSVTIDGNWIYRGFHLICANALATYTNDYWTVSNNLIGGASATADNKSVSGVFFNYTLNSNIIANKVNYLNNAGILAGIYQFFGVNNKIQKNKITGLNSTSSYLFGIYNVYASNSTVNNNEVNNLTNTSSVIYGIYNYYTKNLAEYSNSIMNLNGASTVYGVYVYNIPGGTFTGDSLYFANNAISRLNSASTIYGVYWYYGKGSRILNNSVHLSGARASTSLTYCMYISGSSTNLTIIDSMYNNSLSNTFANTSTGKSYCIYVSNGTTSLVSFKDNNSDYNNYNYVNGNANSILGYWGGAAKITIDDWKNATSADANSDTLNPQYMSDTLLVPQDLSPLKNKGVITSASVDIVGAVRNNPCTIGAYENTLDLIKPVIAFKVLDNTQFTSNRTFTAQISDNSGFINSALYSPRVYYKKSTQGNDSMSWQYNIATGTYPDYSFTIDSAKIGGLKIGDIVQYFVVAQDEASIPNITFSGNCGTTNEIENLDIPATAFPITGAISQFRICPALSKVKTIGVGGDYLSFTGDSLGFFNAISKGNVIISGDLTIKVISDIVETGKNYLTGVQYEGGDWTIKVVPDTNTLRTISGSKDSVGGILRFLTVKNFTIDGSFNSKGSYLRIINDVSTSYRAGTIGFLSAGLGLGCSNDTVKNCTIVGPVNKNSYTYAIYLGDTVLATSATKGNNNNICIANNQIYRGYNLIWSYPDTAQMNKNCQFINNTFGGSSASSDNNSYYAIHNRASDSAVISGNIINAMAPAGVMYSIYNYITKNSTISHNTISNMSSLSTTFYGIYNYYTSNSKIIGNTISNISSTSVVYPLYNYYSYGLTIEKNTINKLTGTTIYGICAYNSPITSYYGYSGDSLKLINNSVSSLYGSGVVYGMYLSYGKGCNIINNSVHLTGNRSSTSISSALFLVGSSTNKQIIDSMYNNSFTNYLVNSSTGKSYAIDVSTAYTTFNNNDCNNNNYVSFGTPGVNFFGNWQGTDIDTLPTWQATSSLDVNSLSLDPAFSSDIILAPSASSPLFTKGVPTSVTTDILDSVRNTSAPTIGAYEMELDLFGPVVNFTKIASDTIAYNINLLANIYDVKTGLDTIATPRLYYKKASQANDSAHWQVSLGVGGSHNYSFAIDIAKLGGLVIGDSVQYFIVAKDLVQPSPNYTMTSGYVSDTLRSVVLSANNFPISGIINSYDIVSPISGNFTLGVGGDFLSLTGDSLGLFKAINRSMMKGDLTIKVISDLNESGANTLSRMLSDGATHHAVNIIPNSANLYNIQGSYSGALIRFSDAKNFTIDGSFNSTGSYFNINNSNIGAGATILLTGESTGCKNITIKYCTISKPETTASTSFVIFSGKSSLSSGTGMQGSNDSITLSHNRIYGGYYGVYSYGNSAKPNVGWVFDNNTYGDASGVNNTYYYWNYLYYHNDLVFTNNTIADIDSLHAYYFLYSSNSNNAIVKNNLVSNLNSPVDANYSFYFPSSNNCLFENNTITNVTTASTFYGFYSTSGTGNQYINNNITNINCDYYYGFYLSSMTNNLIKNNLIYNINGTTTSAARGIYMASSPGTVVNNSISKLSSGGELYGISTSSGSGYKFYHNSVHLLGTKDSTYKSAAFSVLTSTVDSLYNNTFSNFIVNSASTGNQYAIYSTGTFTNVDNNNYYASGNNFNILGYHNTDIYDLVSWQNATLQDNNSKSEDPGYLNGKYLVPGEGSGLYHHGFFVGIYKDILDSARDNSYPSIGCFENIADMSAPDIKFTPIPDLIYTALLASTNLTAEITDGLGLVNTSTKSPRLYYKKATASNDSASWKYVSATGIAPNFDFTLDFSAIGGVNLDDEIQYFIMAQDTCASPNVASSASAFKHDASSTILTARNFPVITPNSFIIKKAISGIVTVGASGEYLSLTGDESGLFKQINKSILTGDLIVKVIDNTTETGANALSTIVRQGGDWKISIMPDGANLRTLSGSTTLGGLIKIKGVSNVSIDGSFNSTGRYLAFVNNSITDTSTVFAITGSGLGSGCKNISVNNCLISAGLKTLTTSSGIYVGNTTLSATAEGDNDNISIIGNSILQAYNGIYIGGTLSNDSLIIKNNSIGSSVLASSVGYYGIILSGSPKATVYGNEIQNIQIATSYPVGIKINAGNDSALIENNIIHKVYYTGTGGYGAYGVNVLGSNGMLIANNLIYDINGDNDPFNANFNSVGLRLAAGVGTRVYYNTINLFGAVLGSRTNRASHGLSVTTTFVGLELYNNCIVNTQSGQGTAATYKAYAITFFATPSSFVGNNNNYYVNGDTSSCLAYYGGVQPTLLDWQNVTSQDAMSKSEDPQFYSNDYYLPTANSPLLNSAQVIDIISDDITGALRNTYTPTIGAYENPFSSALPSVETVSTIDSLSQHRAISYGTILSQGGSAIQAKGLVLDIASYPSLTNNIQKIDNGAGFGAIKAIWTNIDAQRTYYFRAYATNLGGTSYGSNVSFTTLPNYYAPAVTSSNASSITSSSAIIKGEVTSEFNSAITERGFIWNTTNDISITDYLGKASVPAVSGSYINAYSATLSGLAPSTTYYFRAFATNGVGTNYGSILAFTTLVEGYTLSGTVSYAQYNDDPINTKVMLTKSTFKAMPKAPWVKLYNASGTLVDSTTADAATGAFSFTKVVDGAYRLVLDTNMSWTTTKGYQLTLVDYKYIKEYVVSLVYLDSLQMRAANIDRSGSGVNKASITLSDAANLMQRIVGLANASSWKSSNYMYAIETVPSSAANHTAAVMNLDMTVIVSGANKTGIIVRGLSSGDVNGQ